MELKKKRILAVVLSLGLLLMGASGAWAQFGCGTALGDGMFWFQCDVSGTNYDGTGTTSIQNSQLIDCNFNNVTFDATGTNFTGTDLTDSIFTNTTNFTGADLVEANDVTGVDISGGLVFDGTTFGAIVLSDANLSSSSFQFTDFTGADLTGATLSGADFTDADFTNADLTGATGLSSATTTGVTYSNTVCPDGYSSDDHGGNCTGDLTSVDLASFKVYYLPDRTEFVWETKSETNTAGFNILKRDPVSGEFVQVNPALIPAKGNVSDGDTYYATFLTAATIFSYILEEVDTLGNSTTAEPTEIVNLTDTPNGKVDMADILNRMRILSGQ